jgi:streptomycin 6-kinase
MSILIPESFSAGVTGRAPEPQISGDAWLLQLPGLVEASLAEWDLTLDGSPMHGVCALVLPVRLRDDSTGVLKVTWPHADAEHEHLALQHWGGRGAVRLLAANPGRWTMLLERLDGGLDLEDVPIEEACRVIGGLLRQLDHPALPQLSRLSAQAVRLVERLDSAPQAIPRRFVEQARAVLSDLMTDEAIDSCMVHTDLHYGNVLAADAQPRLGDRSQASGRGPGFRRHARVVEPMGRSRIQRRPAAAPPPSPVDHL